MGGDVQNCQHQHHGEDHFDDERTHDVHAFAGRNRDRATGDVGGKAERCHRTDNLRENVGQHFLRLHLAAHQNRDGHGRVELGPADVASHIHHGRQGETDVERHKGWVTRHGHQPDHEHKEERPHSFGK